MAQENSDKNVVRTGSIFAAICAVTFFCFLPGTNNGFLQTWDDGVYVLFNEHIHGLSLETIRWAFFELYAYFWGPLTWLSFSLDHTLWGLNPAGYHLTNAVIHAVNAGLFFMLSHKLLKLYIALNSAENNETLITQQNALYCAILAALFFALHPLRVESVGWITERKDVLSLFFGLSAVLTYLRYAEQGIFMQDVHQSRFAFMASYYYWLAIVFCAFSLSSKATLVTLPLILLILDWFPLRRYKNINCSTLIIEKLPFIGCAAGTSLLIMNAANTMPLGKSDMISRILIALRSAIAYLYNTIYPLNLSPFYPHPGNIATVGIAYLLPIAVFLIITACGILLIKNKPFILAAWLIYLISLLPMIGIVQPGYTSMADRFTYLPSLPVSLFIAVCMTVFISRFSVQSLKFFVSILIACSVLIVFCGLTIRQLRFWKDDVALWSRAIEINPHTAGLMYFKRATGYELAGNDAKALPDMDEAINIALRKKHPMMYELYVKRARIHKRLGNLIEAVDDYSNALATDTSSMRLVYFMERGMIYRDLGKTELAEQDIRMASELQLAR